MVRTLQYIFVTTFLLFMFANFTNHYNQGHFGNNFPLLILVIFVVGALFYVLYKTWSQKPQ